MQNDADNNVQQHTLFDGDHSATDEKPHDDLAARAVALDLMHEVMNRKTALDVALDRSQAFAALPQRDRGFARMVLTTTLRRLGQVDDLIAFAVARPDALKIEAVRHILRLAVTQLFFMDVPDHAAVDTAVRLTEARDFSRQKGFVNGVLRKLTRHGKDRLNKQDAGRLNTPEWLLSLWIGDYGMGTAAQIAEAHLHEASLDVSLKDQTQAGLYAAILDATVLPTGSVRRHNGGNIRGLEGYDDGDWWVQDAAAAIPARLFGDVQGKTVADICAAPGGKTLQLAAMGAEVIAIDRSAKRMVRLHENLERMGFEDRVRVEVVDAAAWTPSEPLSHILLDAPCSATGTMRRHPDTGYLKSLKDIKGLQNIQHRLLAHSATILAVGGTLIYCTCSLQKDEGERQIDGFLAAHPNFARQSITAAEVGGLADCVTADGDLRILPFHMGDFGGMDGFFVARLVRNA